jgi:hypothetical protein
MAQSYQLFHEDFPGYYIPLDPESDFSLKYNDTVKEPFLGGSKKCYHCYNLKDRYGKWHLLSAHKIMAIKYLGFNIGKNKLEIDHKDHDPSNNKLSNLDPVEHWKNIERNGSVPHPKHKFIPEIPEDSDKVISYEGSHAYYEYYKFEETFYKFENNKYLVIKPSKDDGRVHLRFNNGYHDIQPNNKDLIIESDPNPKPKPVPKPKAKAKAKAKSKAKPVPESVPKAQVEEPEAKKPAE